MRKARKQLETIAVSLFLKELSTWPFPNLAAYVEATAEDFDWSQSACTRAIKQRIDRLFEAVADPPEPKPTRH